MNTTTTSSRKGRIGRAIASCAVALSIVTGSVVTAAPANAATTYGSVGACFTQVFQGARGPLPFRDVYLDVLWYGQWTNMQTLYTDRAGCIPSAAVVPGYTWRLRVNLYERPYTLTGTSAAATVQAGYFYDLGPVYVLVR